MYTIEIKNLVKKFGERNVLNNVSLNCEMGKVYGIIGYNGSGKTVLFKCICGFFRPDGGEIFLKGKTHKQRKYNMNDVGAIIEEPAFLCDKSAYKNLEYLYIINHKKNKDLLYDVLKCVGLKPDEKKCVRKYSMGMKQRLAIAQAIMENPDILILDEPMNGLDKDGVKEIRKLILELRASGKTILLASHNKEDIEVLCDEVYEMEGGILQRVLWNNKND